MTRLQPLILSLILAVGSGSCLAGPDPVIAGRFEGYAAQVALDWEVPGLAVAVVKDGELVLARGYGVRELGADGAIDEHTLFAIGSTTKAMTAAVLGTLVEEGKLGWDDPVIRHLPGFKLHDPYVTREVTVRDLLVHRAGLGNADLLWYGSNRPRREILDKLVLVEPTYSLRDGFVYQNLMYIAAGELAGQVADSTWEELMRERIFGRLGMKRSVPLVTEAQRVENVATPHDRIDDVIEVIENETADSAGPAGTVWSSVSEMSHWVRMLLANGQWQGTEVLAEETVAELLRPQTLVDIRPFYPAMDLLEPHWMTYALGWFQIDYNGWAVSFHTGSIDGMAAIVGLVPDQNFGIVVLENLDHAEARHALLWKAIDLWGGVEDGRDWSADLKKIYDERASQAKEQQKQQQESRLAGTSPSVALKEYAGTYTNELYDGIEVSYTNNKLRLVVGPRLTADLEHWHHDSFRMLPDRRWQGPGLISFSLDTTGTPSRLEFSGQTFDRAADD